MITTLDAMLRDNAAWQLMIHLSQQHSCSFDDLVGAREQRLRHDEAVSASARAASRASS